MSNPRTPEIMCADINALNGNSVNGTHNPVTVAQMEAIYAEARKMEWTDKKPDRAGWWAYKDSLSMEIFKIVILPGTESSLFIRNGSFDPVYFGTGSGFDVGQWSTRPIDMPEEKK